MLRIRSPYWLRKPGALGTFAVDDQKLIGLPENPPALPVEVVLQVSGQELRYTVDTKYRTADTLESEVPRPLVIAPPVLANVANYVLVFPTNESKTVTLPRHGGHRPCERRTQTGSTAGIGKSLRRLSR